MSTAYETIQIYCQQVAGVTSGAYNENMVQAAKAATGLSREMTADEAEILLLQNKTGNLTDTLPGLRALWPTVIAAGPYDPASSALFAAMTTQPTVPRAHLIDTAIRALKTSGAWAKMDTLYLLAAADEQASRLNWIAPGTNTITAVNSPTFTADRGWQGDGATSYLNTNFASNGGGSPKYTANAAHIGLWSRTDGVSATSGGGDMGDNASTDRLRFGIKNNGGNTVYRPNSATVGVAAGPASAIGHFVMDIVVNAQTIYRNAVSYLTDTLTTGVATSTQYVCAASIGGTPIFSARQFAAFHAGGTLGAGSTASAYAAISAYLTGVGAA